MSRREPQAMTVEEVAAQMKCHPVTIRRAIRAGRLPAARFGHLLRIDPADVDALFVTAKAPR